MNELSEARPMNAPIPTSNVLAKTNGKIMQNLAQFRTIVGAL